MIAIWAFNGQYVVLAVMKTGYNDYFFPFLLFINLFCSSSADGSLIFVNTADMSIMSKQEHPIYQMLNWIQRDVMSPHQLIYGMLKQMKTIEFM